jgi:hypothetical protein
VQVARQGEVDKVTGDLEMELNSKTAPSDNFKSDRQGNRMNPPMARGFPGFPLTRGE